MQIYNSSVLHESFYKACGVRGLAGLKTIAAVGCEYINMWILIILFIDNKYHLFLYKFSLLYFEYHLFTYNSYSNTPGFADLFSEYAERVCLSTMAMNMN